MPVIAMTREMGSRGKDLAIRLADELGLTIVHHELVEHHVAERMHIDDSAVHRFLETKTGLLERLGVNLDRTGLALHTAEEIYELAEQGNVIIRGWGGAQLLRGVSHVICVRVCAPMRARVKTLMGRVGIEDEEAARREIEANDAAHARVIGRISKRDWKDPLAYDLIINTDRVPVETGAATVKCLLDDPRFRKTDESQKTLKNLKLEAQVRAVLRDIPETHNVAVNLNIKTGDGRGTVSISGAVSTADSRLRAERSILALPDVTQVENNLIALNRYAGS